VSAPLQPQVISSSQLQPPQSWLHRHWKGLVATGVTLAVVTVMAVVVGVVALVMWTLRQSDVLRMAMEQARKNPAVVQQLGTPINPGWLISGSMHIENDSGTANFTVPIHGPRQEAKLYLDARKRMGEWTFNSLTVKTDSGQAIEVVPVKPD
jgi:hypothetical protein